MSQTEQALDASAPAADEQWHRLSPRMLLIHPIIEVGRALPALIAILLAGSGSGGGHWWTIGVAGVVAVFSLSRWFTTRLRITRDDVQLRHGLIRRRTVTTSRDRIRTVDVTSHVLHRALGLARVVVGTGTNDRKGTGRIVLDGLRAEDAVHLRDALLHGVTAPTDAAEPLAVDALTPTDLAPTDLTPRDLAPTELARLDLRWTRYAPFTLSGVASGVIIWGFFWRVQSESRVDLLHRGPLRAITRRAEALPTATAVLLIVVGLVLFIALTSTVGYLLAFWRFRLLRHRSGTLQVTRGLLTTRATSIERRRLVGVELSDPLPLRWVGAVRMTAIATGLRAGRGAERGGEVLLPPAPRAVAESVAHTVLDDVVALTTELTAHSPAARRRRIGRAVAAGVAVAALGAIIGALGGPGWPIWAGLLTLALSVPLGIDRFRNLGHAHVDGYLITASGSLVRRRSVVADSAVIGWNIRSTLFQRRQGLVTLVATTAAGRQGYAVFDVDSAQALELASSVTSWLRDLPATRTTTRATSN